MAPLPRVRRKLSGLHRLPSILDSTGPCFIQICGQRQRPFAALRFAQCNLTSDVDRLLAVHGVFEGRADGTQQSTFGNGIRERMDDSPVGLDQGPATLVGRVSDEIMPEVRLLRSGSFSDCGEPHRLQQGPWNCHGNYKCS